MIYLQTIIKYFITFKSSKCVETSVKRYIQLFTNEKKTIYKLKTENFKCLTEAC